MNLKEFLEGVTIISKYYDKPDGYHLGAEHDQIYLWPTDKPVSSDDVAALIKLGWFQEDGISEDEGEYDPDYTWSAFV